MGIFRNVYVKFKNFQSIKEDLIEKGMITEEIEEYEALYSVYEDGLKDINKVSRAQEKAENKFIKEKRNVERLKNKMRKMKEKAGPLASLQYSKLCFWSKEGKIYRALKRRMKVSKQNQKIAEDTLDILNEQFKSQHKKLKKLKKTLKKSEKNIRKAWKKSKENKKNVEKQQTKKSSKKNFKKETQEDVVFGKNNTIDRNIIETLKTKVNPELGSLSPEEFMAFVGSMNAKKVNNEKIDSNKILSEIKKEENKSQNTIYAKQAIKDLETMLKNMDKVKDKEQMNESDKFIYAFAKSYKRAQEETAERDQGKQKEKEESRETA